MYLVIVEFLVIVDRLCRPIVYFSMYFSRNSGITRYSGHFAADGQIHYYESRLYLFRFFLQQLALLFLYFTCIVQSTLVIVDSSVGGKMSTITSNSTITGEIHAKIDNRSAHSVHYNRKFHYSGPAQGPKYWGGRQGKL